MGWLVLAGFCAFALYRTGQIVGRNRDLSFLREHFFALLFSLFVVVFVTAAMVSSFLSSS
jgi:hypothetical protein